MGMAFIPVLTVVVVVAAATDAANGESSDESVCVEPSEADVKNEDKRGVTGDVGIVGFTGVDVSPNMGSWPYGEADEGEIEDVA